MEQLWSPPLISTLTSKLQAYMTLRALLFSPHPVAGKRSSPETWPQSAPQLVQLCSGSKRPVALFNYQEPYSAAIPAPPG